MINLVGASNTELRQLNLKPNFVDRIAKLAEDWQVGVQYGGMQLAIYKNGQLIVSLWCGRDNFTGHPIRQETLFPLLSATKGMASLAVLHLHHLGYFDWADPIRQHWPAFGIHGKDTATIEQLLSHQLGLPNVTADWRHWPDRSFMTGLIEQARPEWLPGSRYGYHGGSWGVVVDELVRRWTGEETGDVLREALAKPLDLDHCHIGLIPERYPEVARLAFIEPEQRRVHPLLAPFGPDREHNSAALLATCQSSGGGVASAKDLASLYNLAACEGTWHGRAYWSPADQAAATQPRNDPLREEQAARPELSFAWGLGFMVSPSPTVYGSMPIGPRIVGHPGASGAIGYADPDHGWAVGFTINGVGGRQMYRRYRLLGDLLRSGPAC